MKEIEEMLKMAQEGYEAEITNVEKMNSKDFFGKSQYEDREGYVLSVQLTNIEGDEPVEWREFFAIPKNAIGFPKSKIGLFCERYGKVPAKGLKVDAEIGENGFFEVKL